MLEALIASAIYCVIIIVVCWLLVVLVSFLPIPARAAGILPTIIWAIGVILCLVVLLHVVRGTVPGLL